MTVGVGGSTAEAELAGLAGLSFEVHPISAAERRARCERAARLMADRGVDAILLPAGTSLFYFTGLRWNPSERLTAMLEKRGVKARDGFRVLYIAILGRAQGVPVFDAMAFSGPEVSVQRLRAARARLEL